MFQYPQKSIIRGAGIFQEPRNLGAQKCYVYIAQLHAAMTTSQASSNSAEGLNKRVLEDCGHSPMAKYRRVLGEAVHLRATNRGFTTTHHIVAPYEKTKKGFSYLYIQKNQFQVDEIHKKPLNLKKLMQCNNFITSDALN